MADYAVSTNLISWVPAHRGIFGWPSDLQEADLVRGMRPGDLIVPKFAQNPTWNDQAGYQREICAALGEDFDAQVRAYNDTVQSGRGAVPFVLRVTAADPEVHSFFEQWAWVPVELLRLPHPLSTSEFLRLRHVPVELASQFKAMAAPGRRIQRLPNHAGEFVRMAGEQPARSRFELRSETLVRAAEPSEAQARLHSAGLEPIEGDRAFLVTDDHMPGLHVATKDGSLVPMRAPMPIKPRALAPLLRDAEAKAVRSDYFTPARAYSAATDLQSFLDSDAFVRPVPEFSHFHDRFVILSSKLTQAMEISKRPGAPAAARAPDGGRDAVFADDEGESPERDDLDKLSGLTVEDVERELGATVLPRAVLAEAVTALRSGKHLLLSGPPGTGKSTIAAALCRAVVQSAYTVVTATADWTSFDTIGGYMPQPDGDGLGFEPGVVLRCLETGSWLVIDELNRADIDKSFGPLFTLLAGSSSERRETVTLPFRQGRTHVEIQWATARSDSARYAVTPAWRVIGTMNVSDKASLFQLSYAFLRRFAVIDVPLPPRDAYRDLIARWLDELPGGQRRVLVDAAVAIAHGPVELGPAIMRDVAAFVERGLGTTATGEAPYDDPVAAFLVAVRLYAVPQYEGATASAARQLLEELEERLPQPLPDAWSSLRAALEAVTLSAS